MACLKLTRWAERLLLLFAISLPSFTKVVGKLEGQQGSKSYTVTIKCSIKQPAVDVKNTLFTKKAVLFLHRSHKLLVGVPYLSVAFLTDAIFFYSVS